MPSLRLTGTITAKEYLVFYFLLSLLIILLNLARYLSYNYSGFQASKDFHESLLKSILGATFEFFNSTPSGRITSRFSVDMDTIDFAIPGSLSSLVDAVLGMVRTAGGVLLSARRNPPNLETSLIFSCSRLPSLNSFSPFSFYRSQASEWSLSKPLTT